MFYSLVTKLAEKDVTEKVSGHAIWLENIDIDYTGLDGVTITLYADGFDDNDSIEINHSINVGDFRLLLVISS